MTNKGKDYEVGYGRPPKATRFKKGQSGNPAGRRKGSSNLKTDLLDALEKELLVGENGRQERLTVQQIMLRQQATKGAKGDTKATFALLELRQRVAPDQVETAATIIMDRRAVSLMERIAADMEDDDAGAD